MERPGTRDIDGAALRLAAAAVGWREVAGEAPEARRPRVTLVGEGPAAALMAALSVIVAGSSRADWRLQGLSFEPVARGRGKAVATFAAGHGVMTARGMASAHGRPGPASAIGPDLLDHIRRLLAEGLSYRAVAARLDQEGVPTPRGARRWRHATVHAAVKRGGSTG